MLSSRSLKALILAAAVILAGCDRQSGGQAQPPASPGAAAAIPAGPGQPDTAHRGGELPDLVLTDAAGAELRLRDLRGKPLLVNLWATWCGPCVTELPMLARLAGAEGGRLRVLAVNQDIGGEPGKGAAVARFLRQRGAGGLGSWRDPENRLIGHYSAETLPTTVYYDADGREQWRITGSRDWNSPETARLLKL